jgi:hypothetical protein
MKKKASAKELATLLMTKVIIEDDPEAARAALKANADYQALWLDGAMRLRELAQSREAWALALAIEEEALSRGLKGLPPWPKVRANGAWGKLNSSCGAAMNSLEPRCRFGRRSLIRSNGERSRSTASTIRRRFGLLDVAQLSHSRNQANGNNVGVPTVDDLTPR